MLTAWYYESFVSIEYEYRESIRGRFELPVNGYRASFIQMKGMADFWALNSHRIDPDYVAFIEENVLEH